MTWQSMRALIRRRPLDLGLTTPAVVAAVKNMDRSELEYRLFRAWVSCAAPPRIWAEVIEADEQFSGPCES